MRKKILLLNPPPFNKRKFIRSAYCNSVSKAGYYWAPIDLLCQSGILKDNYDVRVIDATGENWDEKKTFKKIYDYGKFDGLIFLTSLASKEYDFNFLRTLRASGHAGKVVLSGGYLLFEHKEIFENELAEGILLDYVSHETNDFFADGTVKYNTISTPENMFGQSDIAEEYSGEFQYPVPLHLQFPVNKYYMPYCKRLPMTSAATSVGCPHRCNFCTWANLKYRCRNVENTIEELDFIARNNIKEIMFVEPLFGGFKNKSKSLLKKIIDNKIDITFSIECRVNLIDEEFADLLSRAGCHDVMFGVETGNDALLENIRKGFTVEDIRRAFKICKKYKIGTTGHFIIGLPGENRETIKNTIDLAKEIDCDFASFNMVMTLPGTTLYKEAEEDGKITKENALTSCSDVETPKISYSELTPEELKCYTSYAFRSFYIRPDYIVKTILKFINPVRLRIIIKEFLYFFRKYAA